MAAGHGLIYVSNLPYEAHEAVVQQAFEDEQIAVVRAQKQLLRCSSLQHQQLTPVPASCT
jgi:hypothetical protein